MASMSQVSVRFSHPETGTVEVAVSNAPLIVGREQGGADITLRDGRVSRRHGQVWLADNTVWYQDLGSSNGSWLDGQRLTAAVPVDAERAIVVGETTLTLARPAEPAPGMTLQLHLPASDGSIEEVLSAGQPLRYMKALYEVVQALLGSSTRELMAQAVRVIADVVPAAQRLAVMQWPPEADGQLAPLLPAHVIEAGADAPVSVSLARQAVARREALLYSDADATEHADVQASVLRHGIRSAIYVPLVTAENEAIGVLCVDTPKPSLPFNSDDLHFVRAVGGLLATSLAAEQAREEIRRKDDEARALQARRDAMAAFLKIASHDLRNPLTVALVGARLLLVRNDPATVERMANSIIDAGERAFDLIRTYLEMAALDAGQSLKLEPHDIDVEALVADEIAFAQTAAGKGNLESLTFSSSVSAARLHADPQRLRQVLSNLLSNAIKYSPEGGDIRVEVENQDDAVVFRVKDQGVGISPADQNRLFGQFERVGDNVASGIGLGLWLTAVIVDAHGGRIWVESAPGQGSTFSFTIPQRSPS